MRKQKLWITFSALAIATTMMFSLEIIDALSPQGVVQISSQVLGKSSNSKTVTAIEIMNQHIYNSVDKFNEVQKLLNSPTPPCWKCSETKNYVMAKSPPAMIPTPRNSTKSNPVLNENSGYEVCTEKNSYLEDNLKLVKNKSKLFSELVSSTKVAPSLIKEQCFISQMETVFLAQTRSFAHCEPGQKNVKIGANGQRQRLVTRPCISSSYVHTVKNSFDLVNQCMKGYNQRLQGSQMGSRDVLEIEQNSAVTTFSLLSVESGLHINIVSPTEAGGIGQFVQSGIQAVNVQEIGRVRNHLLASKDQRCRQLSEDTLSKNPPMDSFLGKNCDRVSLENGNPALNLLYTYANLEMNKNELHRSVFASPVFRSKFSMSTTDQEKLLTALASWAHNTGTAGLRHSLLALLHTEYASRKVTSAEKFLNELSLSLRLFPHPKNRHRTHETSQYFPKIQSLSDRVEAQCLQSK